MRVMGGYMSVELGVCLDRQQEILVKHKERSGSVSIWNLTLLPAASGIKFTCPWLWFWKKMPCMGMMREQREGTGIDRKEKQTDEWLKCEGRREQRKCIRLVSNSQYKSEIKWIYEGSNLKMDSDEVNTGVWLTVLKTEKTLCLILTNIQTHIYHILCAQSYRHLPSLENTQYTVYCLHNMQLLLYCHLEVHSCCTLKSATGPN